MFIVAMLHNTVNDKYHPIVFRYAPPPSGDLENKAQRYKSAGHHTEGFDSREIAVEAAKIIASKCGEAELALEGDILWEDLEMPALVLWFSTLNDKLQPVF
jgi:hypothetical protein